MHTASAIRTALAGPLFGMTAYRQFIVYKIVPSESRPDKTDKFPCCYRTGNVKVDSQNPIYWTDAEIAAAAAEKWGPEYGVGFVFTKDDPFWFLDTDGSYRDGKWSDLALSLYQAFVGCAFEVSNSNEGGHFFGTGNVPEHKKTNKAYGLELYTEGRFVALTGKSAVGNCRTDASAVLPAFVETYFKLDIAVMHELTDGPREDWDGPTDDDELIHLALNFPRSAEAVFGGKASLRDLWEANEPVLAKNYPDGEGKNPYNANAADMALAQHLAFFTGCDAERIERLMRKSALVRPKWDRADYLPVLTIPKACARVGRGSLSSEKAARSGIG